MSLHEMSSSRHLAMLRRAGDVMTIVGTLLAALFIATMSGLMMARPDPDSVEAPPPYTTGSSLAQASLGAPIHLAQAVFVRQDVVSPDAIVSNRTAVRGDCGPRCGEPATVVTHPTRERYWSRARAVPVPRCAPADRTCLN